MDTKSDVSDMQKKYEDDDKNLWQLQKKTE